MIIVNVALVLDCQNSEAVDAVDEILREQQRRFSRESCLLDYAIGAGYDYHRLTQAAE